MTATPRRTGPSDPPSARVSPALVVAAAWAWRILVVGVVVYLLVTFLAGIPVISVPIFLAVIFTALLHRPVGFLRRLLPNWLAALVVLVGAVALIGGILGLVAVRIQGNAGTLTVQGQQVLQEARTIVHQLPGVGGGSADLLDKAQRWVQTNSTTLLSGLLSAARLTAELIAGLVLTFFLTLFFLIDGEQEWGWLLRLLPARARPVANGAGQRAFSVLTGWISGTAIIATIHAIVIGLALWLLGTPLALVLVVLVFFGSFIPLIGAFVFGGLAVLVTLLTVGLWPAAVILLAVMLVENLLEGHVYQPLIMGPAVRLHPVIILIALTVGGLLAGVMGAIASIPVTAAVSAAVKYIAGVEDIHGTPVAATDHRPPKPPSITRL